MSTERNSAYNSPRAGNLSNTSSSSSPRGGGGANGNVGGLGHERTDTVASEATMYEEFDYSVNDLTDTSAYMSDDDNEMTKTGTNSFVKYDQKKYNLDRYGDMLNDVMRGKRSNDPLFQTCTVQKQQQNVDTNNENTNGTTTTATSAPSTSDTATNRLTNIEELNVSSKSNYFKYHVYEESSSNSDQSKREEKEQRLLTYGLMEHYNDEALPNHVKQCLKLISEDFVMIDTSNRNKQVSAIYQDQNKNKNLGEVDFDVDIEADLADSQQIMSISAKIKKYKEHMLLKNNVDKKKLIGNSLIGNSVVTSPSSLSPTSTMSGPASPSPPSPQSPLSDKPGANSPNTTISSPTTYNPSQNGSSEEDTSTTFQKPDIPKIDTNFSKSEIPHDTESVEESIQLISTKSTYSLDKLKEYEKVYSGIRSSNFVLEMYEEMYPLTAAKSDMRIKVERYDLLFNRFTQSHEDEDMMHILFEPRQIQFAMQQQISKPFESLLCSVSFYEVTGNLVPIKITETFRFELGYTETVNANTRALFHLRKSDNKIFMLFKFSRPFKGEFNEAVNEMYLKGDKIKEKDISSFNTPQKQKLFKSVQDVHSVFSWACVPFAEALTPFAKTCTTLTNIFLCNKQGDASDDKLISIISSQDATKRPKVIPSKFEFTMKILDTAPFPRRVNPQTFELMIERDKKMVPAAEVNCLEMYSNFLLDLHNLLYIYPSSFNGSNSSFKNIQIIVSYHINDKTPKKEGLRNFLYYFSANPNDLVTQGFTQVSAKNKNPEFSDEIKCKLPSTIGESHHLLFRFFNVAHSESNLTKYGAKDFVGFAILPIIDKKTKRIINGEYELDVQTSILQEDYLQHTDRAKIEKAFRVRFHSTSISYPNGDSHQLLNFFNIMNTPRQSLDTTKLLKSAECLKQVSDVYHTMNPVILTQLFELLSETELSKQLIMKIIVNAIEKYRSENPDSLPAYVKYHFRLDICDPLVQAMHTYFESAIYSDSEQALYNMSFFLSILAKSMIIRSVKKHNQEEAAPIFLDVFYENLEMMTKSLIALMERNTDKVIGLKRLNAAFASFLRYCLSILDKVFIVKIAVRYIESLSLFPRKTEETIVDMQLIFFREFCDFDNYLLLFLPPSLVDIGNSPVESLVQNNNFIFSQYTDLITRFLCSSSRNIRLKAIISFRELITRIAYDPRYQQKEFKCRLSCILFEFVLKFLDIMNEWREMCDRERKNAMKILVEVKKKLTMITNKIATKKENLRNAVKSENKEEKISKSSQISLQNEIKGLEGTKTHLISMISRHEAELKKQREQTREEKRQLFSCIAYILDTMDHNVLKQFCTIQRDQDSTRLSLFLMILQACLQAFEYQGYKTLCDFYISQYRALIDGTMRSDLLDESTDEYPGITNTTSFPEQRAPQPMKSRRGTVNLLTGGLFGKTAPSKSRGPRLGGFGTAFGFGLNDSPKSESSEPRVKFSQKSLGRRRSTASVEFIPAFVPTKGQDAFVSDLIKNEQHLAEHIAILVFKCLETMIQQNKALLDKELDPLRISPFMENVLRTILNFLHLNQSKHVHMIILSYLKTFFYDNRRIIFASKSRYGSLFCEALISLCNSNIWPVRQLATAVLYLVVRLSFETNGGNIDHCQVMTILSLSRTLQYTVPVDNHLRNAIESISKYAYIDPDAPGSKKWNTRYGKLNTGTQEVFGRGPSSASTPRNLPPLNLGGLSGVGSPPNTKNNFASAFNFFKKIETETQEKVSGKKVIEQMATFAEDVEQLSKDLQNLLRDTIAINVTKQTDDKNPHKTEDLFFRISQLYNKIPELRDEWILQLAEYHRQKGQYAEAAQCYFRVIALVFDTLQKNNSPLLHNLPIVDFFKLSPNLAAKGLLPVNDAMAPIDGIPPHAWQYTEKGIVKLLKTTIDLLEMAEQYELTIPLFKIILPLFERDDSWPDLSETYQHMHMIYEQIDKSYKEKSRLFPTYYRMRFFGPWDNDLSGKEFVYKMPKLTKLHQMTKHVHYVFGDDIEMITNPKTPDPATLDPTKRYLQLTNVKPYLPSEEDDATVFPPIFSPRTAASVIAPAVEPTAPVTTTTAFGPLRRRAISSATTAAPKDIPAPAVTMPIHIDRRTEFQRNNNINQFYYETAFSKTSKKLSDKATEIYKRKVIITLENFFPYVKTRLAVSKDIEIILTPVEAAIEVITQQNQRLEDALSANPPDIQNMQMVLSGSVRASVNGGPREIVESFLAKDERPKYDTKHIHRLNEKCHIFLKLCEIGTVINDKFAGAKHRQLHLEIERGLEDMKQLFSEHLTPLPANHEIKQLLVIQELWKKNLGTPANASNPDTHDRRHSLSIPVVQDITPVVSNNLAEDSSSLRLSIPHQKFQRMFLAEDMNYMSMDEYSE